MNKLVKHAFTLIELLVVIAIIGILSGLIIVGMSGMTQKATVAKAQVFSNSLRNSLMMNIVGEYKFDGTATDGTTATNNDVLDSWGGVNNGSVTVPVRTHTPTVRAGSNCVSGSCLEFNGVADYVDLGDMSSIENVSKMTISFWFKATTISSLRSLISKATGGQLSTGSFAIETGPTLGDSILFGLPTSTADNYAYTAAGTIVANNWYNVTCVFDGEQSTNINRMKIYINGDLKGLAFGGTIPTVIQATNTNLNLGRYADGIRYFNGLMDDARIHNAAMPTSQIKERYYAGLNKLFANGGITEEEYRNRIGGLALGL